MMNSKPSRRKFLLALGAGSAGAATIALTKNIVLQPEVKRPDSAESQQTRYTVSEHIRNYYRTARI
jgi:hypothetical protein